MHVDPYYTKQNYTSKVELFLQQGIGVKVGRSYFSYMWAFFEIVQTHPPPPSRIHGQKKMTKMAHKNRKS